MAATMLLDRDYRWCAETMLNKFASRALDRADRSQDTGCLTVRLPCVPAAKIWGAARGEDIGVREDFRAGRRSV
jgi:hypothetical protein